MSSVELPDPTFDKLLWRMKTELPNPTIDEILWRMKTKNLIRCKSACRSWNALISEPGFMAGHLVRSQNQPDQILVLRGDPDSEKNVISLLSSENPCEFQDLPIDMIFCNTAEGEDQEPVVTMLCCKYLLCLKPHFDSTHIILWNPKETEFKILPECHIPLDLADADRSNSELAFGFDSETNDYKVVRMIKHHHNNIVQMELYSLRNDSWRKLEAIPPITSVDISMGTIYRNGMFYWYGSTDAAEYLWSFNMSTELIANTPLPLLEDPNGICNSLDFFLLNERPGMSQTFVLSRYEVWALLEHGVRESWTRVYSIPDRLEIRGPMGSWKTGALFMEIEDGELSLYDPIKQTTKKLNIRANMYSFQIGHINF